MFEFDLFSLIVAAGGLVAASLLLLKLVVEAQQVEVQCRIPRAD